MKSMSSMLNLSLLADLPPGVTEVFHILTALVIASRHPEYGFFLGYGATRIWLLLVPQQPRENGEMSQFFLFSLSMSALLAAQMPTSGGGKREATRMLAAQYQYHG